MQQDNPVWTSATDGRWKNKVWVLLGALVFWAQAAKADQANLQLNLTIYAAPSCTINNNYAVSVNFGDILSTLIDGANYKKEVPYNLSCSNLNGAVTMNLSGTAATFAGGNGALKTDINDLGIAFYAENTRINIGSNFNFNYSSRPRLYAVPIKATGVTLTTGGDFTAGATLIITYN